MIVQPLRTTSISHNIVVLSFVAIIYFSLGYLGHKLAVAGTNSSPIWPAAGFALGALLLLGYRASFSVLLGCWGESAIRLQEYAFDHPNISIGMISFTMAFGAALQAVVATLLIRRYIGSLNILEIPMTVIKFMFFGALSCLIGASIGILAQRMAGLTPWSDYLKYWLTWWLGDSGGVFVITPLMLAWLGGYKFTIPYKIPYQSLLILILFLVISYINILTRAQFLYLFFPAVIWATCRFGFKGMTFGVLWTVSTITLETYKGAGYYVGPSLAESLLFVDLFIVVITATMLILTAELQQRAAVQTVWEGTPTGMQYTLKIKKYFWYKRK